MPAVFSLLWWGEKYFACGRLTLPHKGEGKNLFGDWRNPACQNPERHPTSRSELFAY